MRHRALLTATALALAAAASAQEETPPHDDQVFVAASPDGLEFEVPAEPALDKASAPCLLRLRRPAGDLASGTLLLYAMDFSSGSRRDRSEVIAVATSSDEGRTWSARRTLSFDGPTSGWGDPSVVQLEDGSLRLYVQAPERGRRTSIRSARSEDGVRFEIEPGVRLGAAGNPDVLHAEDRWYLLVSDGKTTELARSADGLAWERDEAFGILEAGSGAACPLPGGALRIYAHARGIESWTFDPAGGRLRAEGPCIQRRGIVADPSPVAGDDGSVFLAFKFQDPRR